MAHHCLPCHYPSPDIENECIECYAVHVQIVILKEREIKYYVVIVDATPDLVCYDQTVFILCYVHFIFEKDTYEIQERFLDCVDYYKKIGEAISGLICMQQAEHSYCAVLWTGLC